MNILLYHYIGYIKNVLALFQRFDILPEHLQDTYTKLQYFTQIKIRNIHTLSKLNIYNSNIIMQQ